MIFAERYHDFSAGHRVAGHENKCASLHGHNYRVHFRVCAKSLSFDDTRTLDDVGRVLDFSAINMLLCQWLETNWDHKFLYWEHDDLLLKINRDLCNVVGKQQEANTQEFKAAMAMVPLPFNPTAERMAHYLGTVIGPKVLPLNLRLHEVIVWETRKCSAGWRHG